MPLQFYSVNFIFSVHLALSFSVIICEVLLSSAAQTATLCKIIMKYKQNILACVCIHWNEFLWVYGFLLNKNTKCVSVFLSPWGVSGHFYIML